MIDIQDINPGESYACKFRVETLLDEYGRIPGLSDTPLKGVGMYEGLGLLVTRDLEAKIVLLRDVDSKQDFIVPFNDIWDIDHAEHSDT
tara:strand:- start:1009 stop:1275 length:267 start_codon:yes stop_codon:yes gene_type:complete